MIVAVAGGKGGVGKSTVALNLAAELDAVVVDADIGMADLPRSTGPNLHDVLSGRASAAAAVIDDRTPAVLPCGRSLRGARGCDLGEFVPAMKSLEAAYDRVVIDCAAGMAADVGLALHVADHCLLVTTPDRMAVTDAIRTRALAGTLEAGVPCVVLNKAESDARDAVRRAIGAPVVVLPEHKAVARANEQGVPVTAARPGSLPTRRFADVATTIQNIP